MPARAMPVVGLLSILVALAEVPATADEAFINRTDVSKVRFRDWLADGRPCHHCPEMVLLPAGSYRMGSAPGGGHSDEVGRGGLPVAVVISQRLAFSAGEVTRGEFAAFVAANPDTAPAPGCAGVFGGEFQLRNDADWRDPGFAQDDSHPVVCVGWEAATRYADWLRRITGQPYRLPSEAEWEYAARSGSDYRYWWGEGMVPNRANCLHRACDTRFPFTSPTGSYGSNRFGLFDVAGNVWEWTADCYDARAYHHHAHYPKPITGSPGCNRVIRGGSWAEGYWSLRHSNREGWKPEVPLNDIGFRVVREGGHRPL